MEELLILGALGFAGWYFLAGPGKTVVAGSTGNAPVPSSTTPSTGTSAAATVNTTVQYAPAPAAPLPLPPVAVSPAPTSPTAATIAASAPLPLPPVTIAVSPTVFNPLQSYTAPAPALPPVLPVLTLPPTTLTNPGGFGLTVPTDSQINLTATPQALIQPDGSTVYGSQAAYVIQISPDGTVGYVANPAAAPGAQEMPTMALIYGLMAQDPMGAGAYSPQQWALLYQRVVNHNWPMLLSVDPSQIDRLFGVGAGPVALPDFWQAFMPWEQQFTGIPLSGLSGLSGGAWAV